MAAPELSNELINELIAQSINRTERDSCGGPVGTVHSRLPISLDHTIKLANGMTLPFARVPRKSPVFCPFHADAHPSAFVVTNEDGVNGVHCATCKRSYWPANGVSGIDFFLFDRIVKEKPEYFAAHRDYGRFGPVFNTSTAQIGLLACNITIREGEPAPPKLRRGLTLVKSAKGTGKTQALVQLLDQHGRVLVIGHRRSLLRQCSKRLGVDCYLDLAGLSPAQLAGYRRLAICLDSLGRLPPNVRYDFIVLDEVEQLLAHFLADTLDRKRGALGAPARTIACASACLCNSPRFCNGRNTSWRSTQTWGGSP